MNRIAVKDALVCPGCDMIVATERVEVPYGSHLLCPRCRFKLRSPRRDTVKRTLALSLTGLILYIPAHFMILLTFDMLGMDEAGSIFDSIRALYRQQYGVVSLVVVLTAQIFPLLKLGMLFGVTLGISRRIYTGALPLLLRWYQHFEEWGMSEVYLIAILVTIIKMEPTTGISYGAGLICFVGLVIVMACISSTFDRQYCWRRIEELRGESDKETQVPAETLHLSKGMIGTRAMTSGLLQCHSCHKVVRHEQPAAGHQLYCPRCGAKIHWRIAHSVGTTWALVLTALILFFPANLLPIMEVVFLGVPEKSTILDGIIYFFQNGSHGIGLIILSASILVPVFKILGLSVLLYSINFRRATRLLQKSIMFRFIAFIGRWSMLDIFVIALLCALVDFGFLTTVQVAPAAVFFTGVVLATMFAAISFDQRLLWDLVDMQEQ